jgi:hypothetical protein
MSVHRIPINKLSAEALQGPDEFREDFLKDVKGWVKRQSSAKTVTITELLK